MSTIPTSPLDLQAPPTPVDSAVYSPTDLICDDGEPLETDWHRLAMNLLIESIQQYWVERTDYYVGGNMFIYYSATQARNRDFRGPDVFLVKNVDGSYLRDCWASWLEGDRLPDVIIELTSHSTRHQDLGGKKELYQNVFRTREYYCYDPERKELQGWRLSDKLYLPIAPDQNGRLECEELGLSLGTWTGPFQGRVSLWPRFFDAQGNVVLRDGEAARRDLTLERQRTAEERQRTVEERQRADALEAEVARLKAQLEAK